MESKDQTLLEEAYGHVADRDKLQISIEGETPNVFYSNKTINVQGQDVLVLGLH